MDKWILDTFLMVDFLKHRLDFWRTLILNIWLSKEYFREFLVVEWTGWVFECSQIEQWAWGIMGDWVYKGIAYVWSWVGLA